MLLHFIDFLFEEEKEMIQPQIEILEIKESLLVVTTLLQMTILVMLLICFFFFIPSVKSYDFLMLVEQWPITYYRPLVTGKTPLPRMFTIHEWPHLWKWFFASNRRPAVGYWPLFN
jgi:hypothetical protein